MVKPEENMDTFINSTYFIIPVWFDDYEKMKSAIKANTSEWAANKVQAPFLLSYAAKIATSENLFCQYRLLHPESVKPENKKDVVIGKINAGVFDADERSRIEKFFTDFKISEVLLSIFNTGVGFFEFKVDYGDLPIDVIIEFAYIFKNMRHKQNFDNKFIDDIVRSMIPKEICMIPFFYCADELKHDCLCYHMIRVKQDDKCRRDGKMPERFYRLRRSYSAAFEYGGDKVSADASKYDFKYSPSSYDEWGGSQEACVNINYEREDSKEDGIGGEDPNSFLKKYKYGNLLKDYHFEYLLILNQRFAAIKYIERIIELGVEDSKELRELNRNIINLKTVFSLRVISSDMIHQNVYNRLYEIMDIDNLLQDLQDNEQQVEILQKEKGEQLGRRMGILLAALSILAVFSALIDATDYLEKFPNYSWIAERWVCLVLVAAVVILAVLIAWNPFDRSHSHRGHTKKK